MKKIILFTLLICSFVAQAIPNRYTALNLNQQQAQQIQQIINNYDPEIQKTIAMIHNNGVSLNQMSRIPTTNENKIAKSQQLSMLSEGSGFLSRRLDYLFNEREKAIMSVLTPEQINMLSQMPKEDITIYTGGNHLIPVK